MDFTSWRTIRWFLLIQGALAVLFFFLGAPIGGWLCLVIPPFVTALTLITRAKQRQERPRDEESHQGS
ncbi:hypothetical protein C5E08_14450 [Rathayibacter iranicus]|uniref:Uncharacterized protein n=2 Tax=Rathayibacter iranicus TaxID=59737 RepID=A0AAD1ENN6_9MICO|nr:hypothetical protein C7V51_14695 [Rathayibacter iranicus]PPI41909.1 hypothetical protein C5E09_13550 [Rathayibacter iranicus]PPI57649.1 hypothetical protein C5E08_14450 [Rathayibacter iranicus]PPI68629.1 hypothetical protein C5E01_13505 [Rathayibacter iranicus]